MSKILSRMQVCRQSEKTQAACKLQPQKGQRKKTASLGLIEVKLNSTFVKMMMMDEESDACPAAATEQL